MQHLQWLLLTILQNDKTNFKNQIYYFDTEENMIKSS